ncbi:unnamed protein product, partial [Medioppia subpectinata]
MASMDFASEMYLERGNSSRATMVTLRGPIDPSKCKIGDAISDMHTISEECFQDASGKGFTKQDNVFNTEVTGLNTDDTCFTFIYLARKETVINVHYLLPNENFTMDQNIILSIKPKIISSGLLSETSTICLKDLLAVSASSYSVAHEIPYVYVSIKGLTGRTNELYIKLEKHIATPSTAWTDLFKPVTPEDERTANTQLISHWIKYSLKLATHMRPGQYKLTLKDSRAFSAFNIKPKVCDDLAHCVDVSIINVVKDIHDPNQRLGSPSTWIYSFVMDANPDTKYITFKIDINYEAHELMTGPLEAQIELITFGDPCQVPYSECENVGRATGSKCTSKAVSSAPNVCPCLYGYSGDRCEKVNYCMTGKSGQLICEQSVASKMCDSEGSTHVVGDMGDKNKVYRCVCQDPTRFNVLNWDKAAKVCKETVIKLDRGWTQVGTDYYPNNPSNEISYEFTEISTDRVDICSTIDYTLGSHVVKFCVRDFMYKPASNFFLTITSMTDKYDATSLTKFTWSVESVLIGTMNMKLIAVTIPPKTTTEIPIYLMSDWIEYNPKINDPLKPRISIDKILAANINAVKIETGILWDTQDMSSLQLSRVAFVADKDIEQSLQITQYNKIQYFKLVVKFTLTNADTTPKTVDLAVTDVSIGDPCDRKIRNVCSNQGTCEAPVAPNQYSPDNYVCVCNSAHYGKNCERSRCTDVDARETCNALPRYALDISYDVTNCEQDKTGPAYRCNCPNEYKENYVNHRCLSKLTYTNKKLLCGLGGKTPGCEFFTFDTNITKWSNEFEPQLTHDVKYKDVFPLYVSEISGDKLTQTFNNFDTSRDYCYTFKYFANADSKVVVSYKDQTSGYIFGRYSGEDFNQQSICVSDLTPVIENNFTIVFKTVMTKPANRLAIYIPSGHTTDPISKFLAYLPLINPTPTTPPTPQVDPDATFDKIFQTFHGPSSFWNHKGNIVAFKPTTQSDVAQYMVSKWVQKTTDSVDVWIKFTSKDFTGFAVQFVTFDDKLQEASAVDTVIGDSKAVTTTGNQLKIKVPTGTAWKFGIKVTYNTLNKELFTIDQFSLNDPCAEPEKHSLINCATRDSHGRFPNKQGDDYCASDSKRGKCEIDPSNDRFQCTCPKVEQYYWDSRDDVMDCKNLPKCFTKGCNKVTENCVEPTEDRPAEDAVCVAKEGYYKDPVTGVTTRIDICNVADRKIAKLANEKPCDDDRAMCEHDFISPTQYTCRCPPGFETHVYDMGNGSGRSVTCTSRKCDSPAFHTCQHKCENDDVDEKDGDHSTYVRGYKCGCNALMYTQSNDTCALTPGKTCTKCNGILNCFCDGGKDDSHRCFNGWEWTADGQQCEIRDDKGNAAKLDKPDDTGRRYCLCDAPYVQSADKMSCVLQGVCGQGGAGRNDCDGKHALCRLTEPKSVFDHPYECVCPVGTIQEAMNKLCQPVCNFKNRDLQCNRINADCNPNKDVKLVGEKLEDFCVCRPGLIMSGGKCMATEFTMKFTLAIKNDLPFAKLEMPLQPAFSLMLYENAPMQDWAGIYRDIESTNALNGALFDKSSAEKLKAYERDMIEAEVVRLLAGVYEFEAAKDAIRLTKCTSDDYMSCDFTAVLKKGVDPIKKPIPLGQYLGHRCHPLTGLKNPDECFMTVPEVTPHPPRAAIPERLLFKTKEVGKTQLTVHKLCESISTLCPLYSTCQNDPAGNSLYSCRCTPLTSFTITSRMPLEVYNNLYYNYHDIETCAVNKVCEGKCEANGWCHVSVEQKADNTYEALPICVCNKGFTYDGVMCRDNCAGYNCTGHGEAIKGPDGRCYCTDCANRVNLWT